MTTPEVVERGRDAYARRSWAEAYTHLAAAGERGGLAPDDLQRLAFAACLSGHVPAALAALQRASRAWSDAGEIASAGRCAFWLAMLLDRHGRTAEASGWLSRARHLWERAGADGAERGYLLIPPALHALRGGDPGAAHLGFIEVTGIADRFGDPDLYALGRLGCGQALVAMAEVARGLAALDEAMVGVTADEVSPLVAGIVYCGVVVACRDVGDLPRAHEWTVALSRWCSRQPGLRLFRGQCLVHRAEIMQLRGEWADALTEVELACADAEESGDPVVLGMARYQQAELLRLTGDLTAAETAYRQADLSGRSPQPGLALLRLAQGRVADAEAAIRRVSRDAEGDPIRRLQVLAASVEILLAAGDVAAARAAADGLAALAAATGTAQPAALADAACGAVALAEGRLERAYVALRSARQTWQELGTPYEEARTRMLLAQACRAGGDHDTAALEADAAREVLAGLRAASGVAGDAAAPQPGGLSRRQVEVLRLVATGASNREIANTLVISEKTVARHVSDVLTKLDLPSRAGATAWAYEHDLV
jgi:DNA-binding CsgD family transcriptional regulator